MIKIMFVCYGNICRSPMAEFMMKDLVSKMGEDECFIIKSSATSSEELGNRVHYGTREVLKKHGISCEGKCAQKLLPSDYDNYDYFIGMDQNNLRAMQRIFNGDKKGKIKLLMEYTGKTKDVADPYWTGDFNQTEKDVLSGVNAFYKFIKNQQIKC